ncbi:MAG: hypothetical protein ABIZ72_08655 [Candidatus Limnocylindrales bacterium]
MHRTRRLIFAIGLLSTLLFGSTGGVSAGTTVDPSTLTPPPLGIPTCTASGPWVICSTIFDGSAQNEPAFDLPCGTVYVTTTDTRYGRRWYFDSKLVRRHVVQDSAGTWSLSPTGEGPVVRIASHATWGEVYTVPGDESSAVGHSRGTDLLAWGPEGGLLAHVSGRSQDDTFTGRFQIPEDPALAAKICEALGA